MSTRILSAALATAITLAVGSTAFARDETYIDRSEIRQVQQTLNTRGFEAGPVDGMMGPATQGAIRQFQQSENLEATGQLNRQTLSALGISVAQEAGTIVYDAATVREVQRTLKNRGYYAGDSSGMVDATTQQAIREFQKSENLEPSGQINSRTLAALGVISTERLGSVAIESTPSTSTIRQVQQALTGRGFAAGPVDGVMGPLTRAALKEFQHSENLEASGRLNRQTLTALGVPTSG